MIERKEDFFRIWLLQIIMLYQRREKITLWDKIFVARCNTIRVSWETKKEYGLNYRKKYIEEFVCGTLLFWVHALLSMSLCVAFFVFFLPLPKWRNWCMAPIRIHNIAMGGILCDELSKIWKSLKPFAI